MTADISIEEIKTDINLDRPKFTCDSGLGEHIPAPIPNSAFFWVFAGVPKSGKTSLALSLLCSKGKYQRVYRKVFHNILVVMPAASRRSLKNDCFDDLDEEKVFDDLDRESMEDIISQVEEYSEEKENTLLFIDDQTTYLKDANIQKILADLVNNRRHYRLSVMLLVQSYLSIPLTPLRKLITHLTLFRPKNKKETEAVRSELFYEDRIVFDKLIRYIYKKPHDSLFLDTLYQTIYRNWNLLKY